MVKLSCTVAAAFVVLTLAAAARGQGENALPLQRMGAGVPAGWQNKSEDCQWTADTDMGPVGVGAAKIRLGEHGSVHLLSPARQFSAGVPLVAAIWAKSDPPGAKISINVCDNVSNEKLFTLSAECSSQWDLKKARAILSKAKSGRYYRELHVSGANTTFWLDGNFFGPAGEELPPDWKPTVQPTGVTLVPQAPWGVSVGDEPVEIQARVVGATQPECTLRLHSVHVSGLKRDLPPVALDTSGVWEGRINVTEAFGGLFGLARIEAKVFGADGQPCSPMSETLVARAPVPVPGPKPDSPFGVHVQLREPDLEAVARLGYKWCRIHDASAITKWGYIEPEPGQWIWHDDQVALVRKHGLTIMGMLDTSPKWESGSTESGYMAVYGAPKDMDKWRNYVNKVVAHYAGAIDYWEVWNEPWDMRPDRFFQNGSPMLYAALLKTAFEEAKKANPNCTIIGVDTYPPFWEQMVLACGALPYYDLISFHRYEAGLCGGPDDIFAQVAQRLTGEQAKYGTPKPVIFTEGGLDAAFFHGSFFSFADPELTGDWSRAADQFPRMYLSQMAAGIKGTFAYSAHCDNRYGHPRQMLADTGFLVRPLQLTLAALAHFTDGAKYETRLRPGPDISAHVFAHDGPRDFTDGPSTVAVVIADGEDDEDMPAGPLPDGVQCFDRWGNSCEYKGKATRGLQYLVAMGESRDALKNMLVAKDETAEPGADTIEALIQKTLTAFEGKIPLGTLFSSRASVAVESVQDGYKIGRPHKVKNYYSFLHEQKGWKEQLEEAIFPSVAKASIATTRGFGKMLAGTANIENGPEKWEAHFAAIQDGPNHSWRYVSLTFLPASAATEGPDAEAAIAHMHEWASVFAGGDIIAAKEKISAQAFASVFYNGDNESWSFVTPEMFVHMIDDAMQWGRPNPCRVRDATAKTSGSVAVIDGTWEMQGPIFGMVPLSFTATLVKSGDQWRLASLCGGPAH